MTVIRGGTVLTPDGWVVADVAIAGDLVTAVGTDLDGDVVIEAGGCLVGPGFVDLHTHLREPGQTWKEDIASGSAAAAAGGFTAVTAMPNTDPPMDSRKVVESVVATAADIDIVDVIPAAALTLGRLGAIPTDLEDLYETGVRLFTDDGDALTDPSIMEQVLTRIAVLPGAFVAQHAEDPSLSGDGHMHPGPTSRRHGIGGLASEAETEMVRRDIEITAATGSRYHCQHVSAAATIRLIEEAKASGLAVTAEVAPHHLTFDETALVDLDPNFKMYPPLRSADDRASIIAALGSGVIDVVATDHAPHTAAEKDVPFTAAPRGVIGLETAAAAVWEALQDRDRLFEALSLVPARLLGLDDHGRLVEPGSPANLVVFDPDSNWEADTFRSKSANSPYLGRQMRGEIKATIRKGRVVYGSGVA